MNLLLVAEGDFSGADEVTLRGRRLLHAREVLKAQAGDSLRVGVRGGQLGVGEIARLDDEALVLRLRLDQDPPPRANLDVVMGIPRPKQLKRVISAAAMLGVGKLVLVNAARVEKSYFDSKVLAPEFIDELVVQGLEQAMDTVAPEVILRERFRPFVEDELDTFCARSLRLLPHPTAKARLVDVAPSADRAVLAIGPDGGWVPFEVELLHKQGFVPYSLGPRLLRTEVALSTIVGQVQQWRAVRT